MKTTAGRSSRHTAWIPHSQPGSLCRIVWLLLAQLFCIGGGPGVGRAMTLLEVSLNGPSAQLSWYTMPGATFEIQSRDSLTTGSWISNATVIAEGTFVVWMDPAPLSGTRYYRLLMPDGEQTLFEWPAELPPGAPISSFSHTLPLRLNDACSFGHTLPLRLNDACSFSHTLPLRLNDTLLTAMPRGALTDQRLVDGTALTPDVDLPFAPYSGMNGFSGEFTHLFVDMFVPCRGPDFNWSRKYRSRVGPNTAQGNGWDFSYNIWARRISSHVELHDGNSRRDVYLLQPDGTFACPGIFREGSISNNSFTLMFADRGRWEFFPFDHATSPGKIRRSVDRNGNAMGFQYDGLARLVRVVDALDRTNTVSYNGDGFISAVTDFSGRQVRYEFYSNLDPDGSFGDLKLVISPVVTNTPNGNDFPGGKTNRYTYSKGLSPAALNGNLLTEINALGEVVRSNRYHTTTSPTNQNYDRVEIEIVPLSLQSIQPVYVPITPDLTNNGASKKTIVNDRAGNVREYYYDNLNRPVMKREFTGRATPGVPTTENSNRPISPLRLDDPPFFETQIDWNEDSVPTLIIFPANNLVQCVYESDLDPNAATRYRGNLRELICLPGPLGGDQPAITNKFEYASGFGKERGSQFAKIEDIGSGTIDTIVFVTRANSILRDHADFLWLGPDLKPPWATCLLGFTATQGYEQIEYFISQHTDARGNISTYSYDANGNLLRATNRISTVLEDLEYNAFGQCTAHILPANGSGQRRRDEYVYYNSGPQMGYLQESVCDVGGFNLTNKFGYDSRGNLTSWVDPADDQTLWIVNSLNQIVRATSPEVSAGSGIRYQTDYFYDSANRLVRRDAQNRDETGALQVNTDFTHTYEYDVLNRLVRSVYEVDAVKTITNEFIYDANDHLTVARSGLAVSGADPTNIVQFLYDERDLRFRSFRAPGSANQSSSQYDYDANGNLSRKHEGMEGVPRVTDYVYDGYNRLIRQTNALGSVTTRHYDANGNVVSNRFDGELTDVLGGAGNVRLMETFWIYDKMNRCTNRNDGFFDIFTQLPLTDGARTMLYDYAPNGQVTRTTDDNTNVTTYAYDSLNRLQSCTDAATNSTVFYYDLSGNVTQRVNIEQFDTGYPPISETNVYAYDGLDRIIRQMDNAGITNQSAYDSRNNCVVETDGRNIQTRYEYDGLNRLVRTARDMNANGANTTESADIVVIYGYDDASRRVTVTDDNTNTTRYVYDSLDRLVRTERADNTTNRYTYDVRDNVLQVTDAQGTVITNGYDLLDRRNQRRVTTAGVGVVGPTLENFFYDGLSRLVTASSSIAFTSRRYDSLGNLIKEIQQVAGAPARTNSATFDGMGNRKQLIYPGGRTLVYSHDSLNRVKTAHDNPPSPVTLVFSNNYLGAHRLARMNYGNGTRLDVVYDAARRIEATTHTNVVAGGVIDSRDYFYDNAHNKTLAQKPLGPHNYFYDSANRLVVSTPPLALPETYLFDGVGNRVQFNGPVDSGFYVMNPTLPEPADFQVNQYSSTPFDNRAYNRNGTLTNTSLGPKMFSYDSHNQLGAFSGPGLSATYKYDCLGRRLEKNVNGTITRFYYDGGRVIEEQNAANSTVATYATCSEEIDISLLWSNYQMQRSGSNFYYHTDDLGSVMKVTDQTGVVVEQYQYGDYGVPGGPSAIGNPYMFHGMRFDAESGLYALGRLGHGSILHGLHGFRSGKFVHTDYNFEMPDSGCVYDPRAGRPINADPSTANNNPASSTIALPAYELNFQTDGPIICQALFQRLAPRPPPPPPFDPPFILLPSSGPAFMPVSMILPPPPLFIDPLLLFIDPVVLPLPFGGTPPVVIPPPTIRLELMLQALVIDPAALRPKPVGLPRNFR